MAVKEPYKELFPWYGYLLSAKIGTRVEFFESGSCLYVTVDSWVLCSVERHLGLRSYVWEILCKADSILKSS